MSMREITWIDEQGRKFKKLIPETAPDSHARMGITMGPPDLSSLGLPKELEIRLHNQLHDREILTLAQARSNLMGIQSAMMAALRKDAMDILALYQNVDTEPPA